MLQPNSRYKTPDDLNNCDREHYEVAKSLVGSFTPARFVSRYRDMYSSRKRGSIIPSDYCFNRDNKGNVRHPRFLLWDGGREYLFVGLDGKSWNHAISDVEKAATPQRKTRRRFLPTPHASLILKPAVAISAITAFNADADVQPQESRAFGALGSNFQRGKVLEQLRELIVAYSTRTSHADSAIIATAIENSWEKWCYLLSDLPDLAKEVVPDEVTYELLAFFLDQDTEKKPRSLATKALHFAAPLSYIPADSVATNKLGKELKAGRWWHTHGLGLDGMAAWYTDYMEVIRQIGAVNQDLILLLLQIDSKTSNVPKYARALGLPKLIDKILWWLGKEAKQGRDKKLFQ